MFINVFRNRKRDDFAMADYMAEVARLEVIARSLPGFLAYRRYASDDGESLTMTEWESEEAVLVWAHHPEHVAAQKRGRKEWYERYASYSCADPRVHTFERTED